MHLQRQVYTHSQTFSMHAGYKIKIKMHIKIEMINAARQFEDSQYAQVPIIMLATIVSVDQRDKYLLALSGLIAAGITAYSL